MLPLRLGSNVITDGTVIALGSGYYTFLPGTGLSKLTKSEQNHFKARIERYWSLVIQCLEFSSFGWFPLFNKVSCLNFVCISSSKMYTNRYWVTKIARMRVFSFFIKITSGHRTLSRKASFWTIRTLSKDYGRIWYGDRKYFSQRPSITKLRELKILRRFEWWQYNDVA